MVELVVLEGLAAAIHDAGCDVLLEELRANPPSRQPGDGNQVGTNKLRVTGTDVQPMDQADVAQEDEPLPASLGLNANRYFGLPPGTVRVDGLERDMRGDGSTEPQAPRIPLEGTNLDPWNQPAPPELDQREGLVDVKVLGGVEHLPKPTTTSVGENLQDHVDEEPREASPSAAYLIAKMDALIEEADRGPSLVELRRRVARLDRDIHRCLTDLEASGWRPSSPPEVDGELPQDKDVDDEGEGLVRLRDATPPPATEQEGALELRLECMAAFEAKLRADRNPSGHYSEE